MAQCTVALDNVLGHAEEHFCREENDSFSNLIVFGRDMQKL